MAIGAVFGTTPLLTYSLRRPTRVSLGQFAGEPMHDLQREIDAHVAVQAELVAELQQRVQQLEEANRRKDRFLATLSHELRNPLAPIRTSVGVLDRLALTDPAVHSAVDIIQRNMVHLVRLVDELLDMSRITSGKIQLRLEQVNLVETLRSAVEAVGTRATAKQLVVSTQAPETLSVSGDRDRLLQVATNLLSNAVKFTSNGGAIQASVRSEAGEAVLSVHDSGIGIPPESLDTIFQPFSQLHPTGYGDSGLGIGLALAKELVQLHGGSIDAHSAGCGSGSVFTVRLPMG